MKSTLAILAVLAMFPAVGQDNELAEVVEVDSASASDLYRRAERWFVDAFNDAQEVIQLRDTVTKTIVGKGSAILGWMTGSGLYVIAGTSRFEYSVEVSCKDGRYRLRVYDGSIERTPIYLTDTCYAALPNTTGPKKTRNSPVEMRDQLCAGVMNTVQGLSTSLREAMLTKTKEDW